jgi:hypothetical protein
VRDTDLLERKYWRAIYDDECKSFAVEEVDWIDGDPNAVPCGNEDVDAVLRRYLNEDTASD